VRRWWQSQLEYPAAAACEIIGDEESKRTEMRRALIRVCPVIRDRAMPVRIVGGDEKPPDFGGEVRFFAAP
jgi:hypothetical protein